MKPLDRQTVLEAKNVAYDITNTMNRKEALVHMMEGMLKQIGPDNEYFPMEWFKRILTDVKEL